MDRREFGRLITFLLLSPNLIFGKEAKETRRVFSNIIEKAKSERWIDLPIKTLFCKVAFELLDFPYIAGSLDIDGIETCIVTFDGFDCVTFFEVSLCLARVIKKKLTEFQDLLKEVTFTRYRGGQIVDYTSRLHYSADWIYDNIRKRVVEDRTRQLGGIPVHFDLNFMSTHPELYPALRNNPNFVEKIKQIEKEINQREYYVIPESRIKEVENYLVSGDIIFFTTSKKGLDYSHIGICYVENQSPRLLHASSKKNKVVLDKRISEYVKSVPSTSGITIVQPLEPV
ncbi:MAG: N-acetylmuramoyl-L-alanine amidase-like domain-containing protein [Candidatus Kapaibacteriota bacterium]|jgi:hypothetical protein